MFYRTARPVARGVLLPKRLTEVASSPKYPHLLRGGAVSRPSSPLSLSNSRATFNRSRACRKPTMKPTAGLSGLDPNGARLALTIPGSAFRPVASSKRRTISIEPYFAHRETS
jgi:hypothetical protein